VPQRADAVAKIQRYFGNNKVLAKKDFSNAALLVLIAIFILQYSLLSFVRALPFQSGQIRSL